MLLFVGQRIATEAESAGRFFFYNFFFNKNYNTITKTSTFKAVILRQPMRFLGPWPSLSEIESIAKIVGEHGVVIGWNY